MFCFQIVEDFDNYVGGASRCGGLRVLWIIAIAFALACAGPAPRRSTAPTQVYRAAHQRAVGECAWFGDADEQVLYFGQSAFWSAYREHQGEPAAAIGAAQAGAALVIGRFDLASEAHLEPLVVGSAENRSGVWDVLLQPERRLYFTTYFGDSGMVDLASGAVRRFESLGWGLNELSPGPEGGVLATRYGASDGGDGGVVLLDPEGRLIWERRLSAGPGRRVAPKSVAYDPKRHEIWVNTDTLPDPTASGLAASEAAAPEPALRAPALGDPEREGSIRHPTFILDSRGRVLQRLDTPEIHFPLFDSRGTGYLAVVEDGQLELAILEGKGPFRHPSGWRRILVDDAFPDHLDFVQEVRATPGGGVLMTRWSGRVHHVSPEGEVAHGTLPELGNSGLYYTGLLRRDRLCATHCAELTVVCQPAPQHSERETRSGGNLR